MHVFRSYLFFSTVILSFLSFSTAAAVPRGALGAVNAQGSVKGWTFDADLPGQSLTVHYYIVRPNGLREFAGALPANLPRADINTAFKVTGDHGTAFSIPQSYRTGQAHTLHMYAIDPQGKNPRIGSRTFSLASGTGSADTGNTTNTGDSSATGTSNSGTSSNSDSSGSSSSATSSGTTVNHHNPRGSFGAIGASGTIYGWAYDPDDPAAAIEAHYYVVTPAGAREPMAAVLADLPRADINRAFKIDGDHGVSFSIPAKYRTGQAHTLQMYAIDPAGGVHPQVASRSFTLSSSSVDDSAGEPPVAAASLDYAVAGVKTFEFSWTDVSDATYYQLFENPDGQSGFSQVGGNIPPGEQSIEHTIALYARLNAQYLLQSCNDSGCTSSATVSIGESLDGAIGVLEDTATTDNGFGRSIVFSADGLTVAVASPFDTSLVAGINGDRSSASGYLVGAVFVFVRVDGVWQQQAYIKASNPDEWDGFGSSISLSEDGNVLAVGARNEDSSASGINGEQTSEGAERSGAVYTFTRQNGQWQQQAYIKAGTNRVYEEFGRVVGLSGDGATLVIAGNSYSSTTYIFKQIGGVWVQDSVLEVSETRPGRGLKISGDGRTLAIASDAFKAVYVYRLRANAWQQDGRLTAYNGALDDGFGSSGADSGAISISGDGNVIAVGAHSDDSSASGINSGIYNNNLKSSGAAYVFTRGQGGWRQQAYIKASNPGAADVFGYSIGLSDDGNSLAVGAPKEASESRGVAGDQWNDARQNSGAVYVYSFSGGNWRQSAYVKASPQSYQAWRFGNAVSFSGDGSILAVGGTTRTATDPTEGPDSFGRGTVYLY